MKYEVATNFDSQLIEKISEFGSVKYVYGKLPFDVVGGGRQGMILPKIGREELRKHIDICHKNGIEFNYLLNASCLDNRELIGKSHKEIMKLVQQIKDDGADSVTVSNMPLLGMIKNQFPDLKVCSSIYMKPVTINEVLSFEKEGADEITLYYNFNRNFERLKKVLNAVKPETSLRVIANNTCLHDCPYRVPGHANFSAHASQSNHSSEGFALDIFPVLCGIKKLEDLGELFMSEWIRPEDVEIYEKLEGNLTLKLTERARPTDWLVRTVRAYSEKSYNGNLFDILNWVDGKYQQIHRGKMVKGALTGKAKIKELLKFEKAAFLPPVFVDNKSLDRFLDHFIEKPCDDRICYSRSPEAYDCNYCKNLADKHVKIDEIERKEFLDRKYKLIDSVYSGRMFGK